MKHTHDTTSDTVKTTLSTIGCWLSRLHQLHQRLRSHFARPEPHQHALLYLQAILSEIPRKNGWQIAEHARLLGPAGIQRLLSRAAWDQDGVRDELRRFVGQVLNPSGSVSEHPDPSTPFPVLVIDESGFPKRGRHSAGVGPQYCGWSGRVENCQVGVFLSYVTALGHALIDRELYLPEDWCADLPRRQAVHIPDTICFRTKPELAQQMVQRAQDAGLPIRWVVADTVYGHSSDLRAFLQEQGYAYVLAIPSTQVIHVQTPAGPHLATASTIASYLTRHRDWQRRSQSLGTKGERLFDWACLPWMQAGIADGRHLLLIRRCLDDPAELAFFLVCAPPATTLSTLVQAIGVRWRIEEDLEASKDLGLDQYEVRSFSGWSRHITLVLLVYAFLVSLTLPQGSPPSPVDSPLIPLTPPEVRHLLARLFFFASSSVSLVSHWSLWRRTHQYWAGYYHRRRAKAVSV